MNIVRGNLYFIGMLLAICLASCTKAPRNFYPDPNNSGLSRLTSYGYNIATVYINGEAYVNPYLSYNIGNATPIVNKIITNSTFDTLSISWDLQNNISTNLYYSTYQSITLLMPIPKFFMLNNFLALSGQRFLSDSNNVILNGNNYYSPGLKGSANIYFININETAGAPSDYLAFSGLFNGNVGDSIAVTKGRFDFSIPTSSINF